MNSEQSKYPNVVRAVMEKPWAILPSKLAAIVEIVALRAGGEKLSEEEISARIGAVRPRKNEQRAGAIALLPLYGTIVPRADMFNEASGGTSVQRFQAMLRDAVADKDIRGILIDIDSPGGQTGLLPELAREVREARAKKPVVAIANTLAASAAYWIGSQATEFVATPSALLGSIGVLSTHHDLTGASEQAGIKTTLVHAGKHKVDLSPFQPLSEEGKQELQDLVDDAYALFTRDVAAGRGVPVDSVCNGFGEGRVLHARAALNEGMIDRIETFEATVGRMLLDASGGSPQADADPIDRAAMSGLSFADTVEAALGAIDTVVADAEALRALTGSKREQLSALVERANELLAEQESTEKTHDEEGDPGLEAELVFAAANERLRTI